MLSPCLWGIIISKEKGDLYQSRKVDTKNIFFLFPFSKVDISHIFDHFIFSKVDTWHNFQPFSFSGVDTSSQCACLRRF